MALSALLRDTSSHFSQQQIIVGQQIMQVRGCSLRLTHGCPLLCSGLDPASLLPAVVRNLGCAHDHSSEFIGGPKLCTVAVCTPQPASGKNK